MLAVSGSSIRKMGGRPVRVPIEKEVYDLIFTEGEPDNLWPLLPDKTEQYRRSLYLLNKRTVRLPMLANFDQPDTMTSCPVRPASTHALQALSLMNSDFMQEQSEASPSGWKQCGADRELRGRSGLQAGAGARAHGHGDGAGDAILLQGRRCWRISVWPLNRNEFVYVP